MTDLPRPLDRVRSIKTKLGLLVAVTILVAATLATVGAQVGLWPWLTIALTVLVALGVTQVLAHGMTAPLRAMTSAARAMATGDYSLRVRATSRDEVGELARAFNRMAADLETVDQQRRELVANVSHELRTPVSALRAVLENLVDSVSEPDPATLRTALAQAERLSRLVTDLLDLSRVDAGVVPLRVEPVPVSGLLHAAAAEAEIADGGVHYAVEVDPPTLRVNADRERLHQAVANLLDNATRHSPRGGTVTLRGSRGHDGGMCIDVVDEGPGIPPDERAAVFERFTRGTRSHADGGTGLGLAIAQWAAHLHGGGIEVLDSPSGCHLRLTLPDNPSEHG